ncbi:MAG: OB-fold nucleic acid binding domain-containing protein, partial [Steroidobacteraceae bacterium]
MRAESLSPGLAPGADDALFLLPSRYEDRTRVTPLGALMPGQRAVIEGEVQLAEVVFRRRRALLARLSDGSGFLTLRFFYFSRAQRDGLARGTRLRCFGEARRGPLGLEMVHPEYRRVSETPEALEQRLTPVYPLTEGETQGRVRQKVDRALQKLASGGVQELLPASVLSSLQMPPLAEALQFVHHPPVGVSLADLAAGRHPAQRRLAFEELLAHQLSLQLIKRRIQTEGAHPLTDAESTGDKLLHALPWPLTGAQKRVLR